MKSLFNHILKRRANALAMRLQPFMPANSQVLDIGSGLGHNAVAIRERCGCSIAQIDVVDMSAVGPSPIIFDGRNLPYSDNAFDVGLMLFILQYAAEAEFLLSEARRVIHRRLMIIQSTYQDEKGLAVLRCREWFEGRLAFRLARRMGFIKPCPCSLHPREYMNSRKLSELFGRTGWKVQRLEPAPWPIVGLSRDLYVLE
jgi:ubiquinone/menaquinone biosynthesis C-methylase UbiE